MNKPTGERPPIVIRFATIDDVDTLTSFNQAIAAETEGRHLDGEVLRLGVTKAIHLGDEVRYFVAQLDLYVEQENQAAQETYRRTGFADSRYIVMNRSLA